MSIVRWVKVKVRGVPVPGGKGSVDRKGPKYFVYEEGGKIQVTYRGEELFGEIAAALGKGRIRK